MRCPSCGEYEIIPVTVPCLDEDGEQRVFSVCSNCDYGINDHTEGECDCTDRVRECETTAEAAWDEGYRAADDDFGQGGSYGTTSNPYRQADR